MRIQFENGVASTLWDDNIAREARWSHSVGYEALCALSKKPGRVLLIDRSAQPRKVVKAGMLLAVSALLARHWRRVIPEKRVGVVLPPGALSFFANLSLFLAGKIPVNLNFTAGRAAVGHALERAQMDTVISVEVMRSKLEDFPWPAQVIDLLGLIKSLSKAKIVAMLGLVYALPGAALAKIIGVQKAGGDEEAALLFTSGSDGAPKGVILTHKNLLSNADQICATTLLPAGERLMATLPVFHSFGFTVSLIYPLLYPLEVVTYFTPLEVRKIGQIIQEEEVTVMVGAPTFLRPYVAKVPPEQLKSIKYVAGGAEKTPEGFHDTWEQCFGSCYLEGYGLTETAPVVAANLPDHVSKETGVPMSRRGSVGKVFPGMRVRIVDPENGSALGIGETGIVEIAGPNVFAGYLGEPKKTAQVLKGEWFSTGDLGRLDVDGFLYIDGRLSRFSKIGGEMVPHGTIETALAQAYGVEAHEDRIFAVTAIPDEAKGEALVLLTLQEVSSEEIREHLIHRGFPNLWVPRHIVFVEQIPTLASGKLDLGGCKKLAQELVGLKNASGVDF